MSKHIKELQKYIKQNFLNKMKIDKFQFTKLAEKMIKHIYSFLLNAEQEYSKMPKVKLTQLSENEMFNGSAYSYIPQEIRSKIESAKKIGYLGKLQIEDRIINIKIIFPIIDTLHNYKLDAEHMTYKIFLWLFIADKYACRKCSKEMEIFLYMTDELKQLPLNGNHIDKINANTAFTTPCSHSTDIHLFRNEEWFKVLIHETFHNLGLDFSTMDQNEVEPKILTLFPLNIPDIRIYESYCETWAELLNIMFTAYWTTTSANKPNVNFILDKMERYLDLEQIFSLYQSTKVLHHYHLTYADIYQNHTHQANLGKVGQYKENTNAFSYYILKPILLFHLNEFIEWTIKYNGETLDFKKTQENIIQYAGLIEQLYDSEEYVENMEKMDKLYRDNHSTLNQTLRMSIIE
jgi:hypothetical protein